ncbi:MAG TPA: sigma factor [Chthonomonadaceae bacterium]|nr:sigma factor [Chthonomonadaceae bacterium]
MTNAHTEFEAAVRAVRPRLILYVRRLLRCTVDDAEDVVSEAVAAALARLEELDSQTGATALGRWLFGVVRHVGLAQARSLAARPPIVSMDGPELSNTADPCATGCSLPDIVARLHPDVRLVVEDWLMGYRLDDIARRLRIHRSTVVRRLRSAADSLTVEFPDTGSLESATSLFAFGARVTIYRRPHGVWRPWRDQHPPEPRFIRPACARRPVDTAAGRRTVRRRVPGEGTAKQRRPRPGSSG